MGQIALFPLKPVYGSLLGGLMYLGVQFLVEAR